MSARATSGDPFRHHGGRIDAARAVFGGDSWIDLSTGIAAHPYPVPIAGLKHSLFALPAPEGLAGLESAAATEFGLAAPNELLAVPGSDLAMRQLAALLPHGKVAVVGPGYGGHVAMWRRPVTTVGGDALLDAARTHDILILANPNNPDGVRVTTDTLLEVARLLALRDGWLIVDEAFADARPDDSLAAVASGNVIVLRSFGKFFGLPGLRLGFVIAPAPLADALRAALGDWPLSGPAIKVATLAYRDHAWQARQRARLVRGALRLDRVLGTARLKVTGGTELFRLVHAVDADALFRRLAAAQILTRPFASDNHRLRIGIPGVAAHWRRLADALDARGCHD